MPGEDQIQHERSDTVSEPNGQTVEEELERLSEKTGKPVNLPESEQDKYNRTNKSRSVSTDIVDNPEKRALEAEIGDKPTLKQIMLDLELQNAERKANYKSGKFGLGLLGAAYISGGVLGMDTTPFGTEMLLGLDTGNSILETGSSQKEYTDTLDELDGEFDVYHSNLDDKEFLFEQFLENAEQLEADYHHNLEPINDIDPANNHREVIMEAKNYFNDLSLLNPDERAGIEVYEEDFLANSQEQSERIVNDAVGELTYALRVKDIDKNDNKENRLLEGEKAFSLEIYGGDTKVVQYTGTTNEDIRFDPNLEAGSTDPLLEIIEGKDYEEIADELNWPIRQNQSLISEDRFEKLKEPGGAIEYLKGIGDTKKRQWGKRARQAYTSAKSLDPREV